ncbi:unnamed protein product [Brassica rapa subsp. narinosa]|uniref:(rape) hypothetical protein n=1 Tax=Brassica napus TaxID=3708 RepID=A0A817A096_BRANA|nr:unnamed protein product [Brassica napus]
MVFPYFLPEYSFMWGGDPDKNLPLFPLPTHDVIVRSVMGFHLSSR